MKIVIATPVYYPMINGVAVFSRNLAVGLARRGHEVIVLTPSQTGRRHTETKDGVKIKYLKSTTIKVYPDQIHEVEPKKKLLGKEMPRILYKYGFKASIFPNGQIRRILNVFQPDVVHVQASDPIGVSVVQYAKKHYIPVVMTEHNQPEVLTEPLHIPKLIRKPVNGILSAYFANREDKSDYVTMPTELSIKHLLGDKELGVPVVAVSNGVDLLAFKPGKAKHSLYKKYGIPTNVPIILYIGRLDPEKRVGAVMEAFGRFLRLCTNYDKDNIDSKNDNGNNVGRENSIDRDDNKLDSLSNIGYKNKIDILSKTLLLVVGDGVDKNRLMNKAKKMGIEKSVKFLGRVMPPDLYEIYKMGDVFVTASEIETQGIVLIEAAATGLPLIAVNAGAVAEICKSGENGVLLDSGDTKGMSGAMLEILGDDKKRQKYAKKSLEIAAGHDLARIIDKFIDIYQKVIDEKSGKGVQKLR